MNAHDLPIAPAAAALCAASGDVALLFSRTPVPGHVKTRMLSHLSPEDACRLHVASTLDVAALLESALPRAAKWLFLSEPAAPEAMQIDMPLPASFRVGLQEGQSLGDRMAAAFQRAFGSGARRALIVGSDSPSLPASHLQQALGMLENRELVLGPSEDGGFYLIGCRRFDPILFRGVIWGSPGVFQQTLENARRLHLPTGLLPAWYDLDEWKDVERLVAESRAGRRLPSHLAATLENIAPQSTAAPDRRPPV